MQRLLEDIGDPPKEYRSLPLWSWNDHLLSEELQWQIREMKDKGIGGFFMHARGGLQTPYMNDEWMNCVRACVQEADNCDLEAWLYDEEGWPSGFAGGKVTDLGDKYHIRWMESSVKRFREINREKPILGIYNSKFQFFGTCKEEISGISEEELCYVIWEESNPYYVDVLNPAVIEKFLELTHQEYAQKFPEELGKRIPGFFTDEPQFAKLKIPYSYLLPDEFAREHGYPLTDVLPSLFYKTPDAEKYRYDFWETISRLYTHGFMRTIYQWCQEHHCKLTGHVMREDSILMQMQATAGVMPSYEYMDIPGIDWLRRRISSPLTPKQVGSVAEQLGKKAVLSEMFAMTGWDCSPEELKWIAQWQYVNGVNRMCQHLESYSIRGARKRDYPPSLFYQQTWWEEYKSFNDYFARLGMLLTWGQVETEVLLLHPIRSGWMLYDGKAEGPIVEFGEKFENLSQKLADFHIDHHYGDEGLLEKYGRVEGKKVFVGQCGYRAVVMPDMLGIEASTVRLLLKFAEAGGKIFRIGEFPYYIHGGTQAELNELENIAEKVSAEKIRGFLDDNAEFPVSVTENEKEIEKLHYQMRKKENERILYLAYLEQNRGTQALLKCKGCWKISLYDPLENTEDVCGTWTEDGMTFFEFPVSPMDSKVFMIRPIEEEEAKKEEIKEKVFLKQGGAFNILDLDDNAITLDYCSYRIGNGEWKEKTPTIQLMEILLKEKKAVRVSLRFQFTIDTDPKELGDIYLIAEVPEKISTRINGVSAELFQCGWWKDKGFCKYEIQKFLQKGKNEIVLVIDFKQPQKVYDVLFGENVLETEKNKLTFETEIESIYLAGKFGVYNKNGFSYGWRKELNCDDSFVISKLPQKLYGDDFTSQGFCFFAGKLTVGQKLVIHEFDDSKGIQIRNTKDIRYIYQFNKPNAMVGKLYINGKLVERVFWHPKECDITEYVHPGENEIVWELYASNRNLLGPHHHVDGELYAIFPEDFTGTPSPFKEDSRTVWSDRYHFVKFGL